MTCTLKQLSPCDGHDIYDMLQRIPADENGFINDAHGMDYAAFHAWLLKSDRSAKQTGLENGWRVPSTTFWLYADGRPVGIGKLRHFLTDALRENGGHIGCAIVPEERGKGYGTILLRALLDCAREMGINQVLVTIRPENAASLKMALKNGGVIERSTPAHHYVVLDTSR